MSYGWIEISFRKHRPSKFIIWIFVSKYVSLSVQDKENWSPEKCVLCYISQHYVCTEQEQQQERTSRIQNEFRSKTNFARPTLERNENADSAGYENNFVIVVGDMHNHRSLWIKVREEACRKHICMHYMGT